MTEPKYYTEAQALDEAVLMLMRRMGRLHPTAYHQVLTSLSDGVREALTLADIRADKLRAEGVAREFPTVFESDENATSDLINGGWLDYIELTKRLGQPDDQQNAVLAWTGENADHRWTEAEAAELLEIWNRG